MKLSRTLRVFFAILFLTVVAAIIALPRELPISLDLAGRTLSFVVRRPVLNLNLLGTQIYRDFELKQGLDIQGGMQVVLAADMRSIEAADRDSALQSAKDVIQRRVDMFGVSEPVIQTSKVGDQDRIIVELAGVSDSAQALQLIGTTALLDFRLQSSSPSAEATQSAVAFLTQFEETGLTGKELKRSTVQYDPTTGEPVVAMEFNQEGTEKFAEITKNHRGEILAIFLDGFPVSLPMIGDPIIDGKAVISGTFTLDQAKQLNIQLNAGALPVPIDVIEQRTIGASLGQDAVQKSVQAGLIGLGCVIVFMVLYYGWKGVLSSISLVIYALFTIAIYKLIGVTLTLPGIAGLLLTIGMAVDSNILIFERMKEELRVGQSFDRAMELGFGRAWDSIKDANVATIFTALVLINPLDFPFLNTSGLVRGFGVTLFIGVVISLFTGLVVTRTLMRLFLKEEVRNERV
ncbi:protein translocase subunit SecD [Patescibacteria group bacterium]|nr:protein translocase subunit SecD [Patescibacteria group bacterium]